MSKKDYIFQESRARLSSGSGIYILDKELSKFKLLIPTTQVPFVTQEAAEVEVKVVTSDTIGKLSGISTLNAGTADFYLHRDSISSLEKISGTEQEFMSVLSDFSAYRYTATMTYTPNSSEMDAAMTGTLTVTPKTQPTFVPNALKDMIPTLSFASEIPAVVELETTTGTYAQDIELKDPSGTITANAEDSAVVTAQISGKKLTITGKAAGSTVVTIKSELEGWASWETTILVIVPAASE